MPDDSPLGRRIEARRWAEECFAEIDDKEAFCERVMQLAGVNTGPPKAKPQPVPMTDAEAREFEKRAIFFGAHAGKSVGDVPLPYLCRLSDPPSGEMAAFLDLVRRYLRNPGVRRMVENGE